MSDSKMIPLIILMVVAGGIVTWGFLTDWTFSGLLPRKGAKCTPEEDEKDENAKQYVYDEDDECTVIKSCKTGWKPDGVSNTACISSSSGDTCTGANGTYEYNDSGVCTLIDCDTGYTKSGTTCVENTCSPEETNYSSPQTGTGDYAGSKLTFKTNCGISDVVGGGVDLGVGGGCQPTETIESHCNRIDECIGYLTLDDGGCSVLLLNAAPVCKHYGDQIYREFENTTIDDQGEITPGGQTLYLNPSCAYDETNRYEKRGDGLPFNPDGGGCDGDITVHENACKSNPECVGFELHIAEGCSHYLYKKSST
jgi:hypothetical protein